MKKRVLITERIDEEGIKLLKKQFDVDIKYDIEREELLNTIENYHGLVVRSVTKVDNELLVRGENLKVVGRAGNGIDNIDVPSATKYGIIVTNTPQSNTMSACEHAITLLLAQSRNLIYANNSVKKGNWKGEHLKGVELYGKTLGIIGLGRIGALVATRMNAFGMKVIAYDPYIPDERFERFKAQKMAKLEDLIKEADFITIHTPKTKETIGMIGEKEINAMKQGVRLVNDARGGIINEKALIKGLREGKIASAGLDVYEKEPCLNNELFEIDNIITTPHIGADTIEAQQNVGITIANQVINAINGEIVTNAVNLPTIHRDELDMMKPYIDLMERLGKIYYQMSNEAIRFVEIKYFGEIASQDTKMISIAFVKGLLEPIIKEGVNYINAMTLAKNRGISIIEKSTSKFYKSYVNLISIKIKTENSEFSLCGSLSPRKEGKLVEIQGYEVDVYPSEYMIFIQNLDVPGVIGSIGMALGENHINVATMQVGRNKKGDLALMLLNVDDDVSTEVIGKLEQVENVLWSKCIRL